MEVGNCLPLRRFPPQLNGHWADGNLGSSLLPVTVFHSRQLGERAQTPSTPSAATIGLSRTGWAAPDAARLPIRGIPTTMLRANASRSLPPPVRLSGTRTATRHRQVWVRHLPLAISDASTCVEMRAVTF